MKRIVLVGFAALTVTAIATFAALWLFNVNVLDQGQANESEPQLSGGPSGDLLGWSTRDKLAICVEIVGEASVRGDAADAQAALTQDAADAMQDVAADSYWESSERLSKAVGEMVIDAGCPGDAKLDCPERPGLLPIDCGGGPVAEPGPYTLFVFVVSGDDLLRVTGGLTRRFSTVEVLCAGDSCDEVTSAVWVSEEESKDREALYALLAEGIGIKEPRE